MKPRFSTRSPSAVALSVAAVLLAGPARGQIFDNFDSGTDTDWTHLEPLAAFGAPGTFSLPNGGYRIQASASPDPATLGPARAGSLRFDQNFAGFAEGSDLVGWDNSLNQSFGLLGRVTNPGFGATRGYAFTYSTAGSISISVLSDDHVMVLRSSPIVLDPTKTYTLGFLGFGDVLTGVVYNHNDFGTPIALVQAEDSTYGQGLTGFYLFSNVGNGAADATFDNYAVNPAAIPEPLPAILLVLGSATFAFVSLRRRKLTGSLGGSGP